MNDKDFPSNEEITRLLHDWQKGDKAAESRLIDLLQEDLKKIVRGTRRKQDRGGEQRQTTELLNELYIELAGKKEAVHWENRRMFFGFAARLLRRLLIDEYRARMTQKRGSGLEDLPLNPDLVKFGEKSLDLIQLDDALTDLARIDPLKSRIVETRFFAGLTNEETAELLQVSTATVKRHWRTAQAWLYQYMTEK
jgi:RNA polymerase sigma factor (TIGR02999 family)